MTAVNPICWTDWQNLSQRMKEHRRGVESFVIDTSALAQHTIKEDHHIGWRDSSILHQSYVPHSHRIIESWYINNLLDTLNREKGPFPELYLSL